MTKEEAITALGDRNNLLWGMSKEEKKYYSEALDMAISALKGGWIPVEERKPEEEKTYVVTVNHGNGAYVTTAIFSYLYEKGWSDSHVTAWREDIEPYKKGE